MDHVLLLDIVHPAPAAPPAGGSLSGWVWLTIVLALVVAGGVVLTSRR